MKRKWLERGDLKGPNSRDFPALDNDSYNDNVHYMFRELIRGTHGPIALYLIADRRSPREASAERDSLLNTELPSTLRESHPAHPLVQSTNNRTKIPPHDPNSHSLGHRRTSRHCDCCKRPLRRYSRAKLSFRNWSNGRFE